jgi:succinate dehydrogenase / fumarate reductase cytochrome b subunit
MNWLLGFYRSTLGKKVVMATTGLILFGFVLAHMFGNLKIYQGADALNHYAEGLRTLGAPLLGHGQLLWVARIILLAAVLLHMHCAWSLTMQNRRARPLAYQHKEHVAATYASRTMRWGGVILLAFIVYHLLHLTVGNVHANFIPGDVYHNVVVGFRNVWVSAFYAVAQVALGFHLYHGLWSLFQSLGWSNAKFNAWRRTFAVTFALVVTLGNLSFPLAVLSGIVK